MIEWRISEYVDERGFPVVSHWFDTDLRNNIVREKFEAKLLLVVAGGPDLALAAIGGTDDRHIDKIRVKGRVAIRVLYCRGPESAEITLLAASKENSGQLAPNTLDRAVERRTALIADPEHRKVPYVFRKKKTS